MFLFVLVEGFKLVEEDLQISDPVHPVHYEVRTLIIILQTILIPLLSFSTFRTDKTALNALPDRFIDGGFNTPSFYVVIEDVLSVVHNYLFKLFMVSHW